MGSEWLTISKKNFYLYSLKTTNAETLELKVYLYLCFCWFILIYVSESDILGPIDYFSNIEKLVSFESAMFADNSFKNKMKIYTFFMSIIITTLKYMPNASRKVYMSSICVLHFYQYICCQYYKIILQRYDIFASYLKNFGIETLYTAFVGQ